MTTPSNCNTCEHKQHPDGGWCYMFRTEPEGGCGQHTPYRAAVTLPTASFEGMDDMGEHADELRRNKP